MFQMSSAAIPLVSARLVRLLMQVYCIGLILPAGQLECVSLQAASRAFRGPNKYSFRNHRKQATKIHFCRH